MARHPRSKASRVRAPFVITASLALLAPACGGTASGGEGGTGAGGSSGAGGSGGTSSGCPTSLPGDGTSCAVGAKDCYYDRCGSEGLSDLVASCNGGKWEVREGGTCNPPPPPEECPSSEPSTGAYCNVAADRFCSYPTSECCPDVEARCVDYTWEVLISSCNPPPPPACPEEMPEDGSDCAPADVCGYTVQTCNYGTCSEGSSDAFTAFCNGTTWSVQLCQGV